MAEGVTGLQGMSWEDKEEKKDRERLRLQERKLVVAVIGMVLATALLITLIIVIYYSYQDDRVRTTEQMQACVAAGGSWVDGKQCINPQSDVTAGE